MLDFPCFHNVDQALDCYSQRNWATSMKKWREFNNILARDRFVVVTEYDRLFTPVFGKEEFIDQPLKTSEQDSCNNVTGDKAETERAKKRPSKVIRHKGGCECASTNN